MLRAHVAHQLEHDHFPAHEALHPLGVQLFVHAQLGQGRVAAAALPTLERSPGAGVLAVALVLIIDVVVVIVQQDRGQNGSAAFVMVGGLLVRERFVVRFRRVFLAFDKLVIVKERLLVVFQQQSVLVGYVLVLLFVIVVLDYHLRHDLGPFGRGFLPFGNLLNLRRLNRNRFLVVVQTNNLR
uniref:(northern house mosquito) hypothetical protein n=1 Tax=Culex pipiens TaxID=7175 RepID=A0A8D8P1F4_CULPI